jgi:hypothetical protein
MGLSEATVSRALRIDSAFREKFDEAEADYLEELQATSRSNALNPRSVIERIFLLKCLLPDKYGQENRPNVSNIQISIGGKEVTLIDSRESTLDVTESATVTESPRNISPDDVTGDADV